MIYDDILNKKEIKNSYQKIDRYNIKNNLLHIKIIYSASSSICNKEYYIRYIISNLDIPISIHKNYEILKILLKDMKNYTSFNFNVNIYMYIFQEILDEK